MNTSHPDLRVKVFKRETQSAHSFQIVCPFVRIRGTSDLVEPNNMEDFGNIFGVKITSAGLSTFNNVSVYGWNISAALRSDITL